MTRKTYEPGPAAGAHVHKEGEAWTLVLVRDLKHPPALVWEAITDPAQLVHWAPFDASRNLGAVGPVKLSTVGTPQVADCTVRRAEEHRLLEFDWGGNVMRWELEAQASGTRLTLWHQIDRRYIAWGAAGWHVCIDILERNLSGEPMARVVGQDALQLPGWQRLTKEYAAQFGLTGGAS